MPTIVHVMNLFLYFIAIFFLSLSLFPSLGEIVRIKIEDINLLDGSRYSRTTIQSRSLWLLWYTFHEFKHPHYTLVLQIPVGNNSKD